MPTLSPSLRILFQEIDARWPRRDRRTDGWYASPNVRRSVGHNPGARGLVHAIDVDDDGIRPDWIVNNIYKGGTLLFYIIWNRTIWSDTYGWRARRYTGSNPHTDHMHIEIYQTRDAENWTRGWGIAPGQAGFGSAPETHTSGFGAADPRDQAHLVDSFATGFYNGWSIFRNGAGVNRRLRP